MARKWNGGVAVVDDEKLLTDLVVRMLELNGIKTSFKAYDGHEAVQKFRECNPKPEIVIMDYRLPATTGVEVMREMRQTDSSSKFVFISADTEVKDEALQAGAVMFMAKPVSMKDLIDALEQVVER